MLNWKRPALLVPQAANGSIRDAFRAGRKPARIAVITRVTPEAGRAFGFVKIQTPSRDQAVTCETFSFQVDKAKLKGAEQRDGHYLLRSNLTSEDPAVLRTRYVQLTQIESVFRSLKSELSIRPIRHQLEHRADAHVLIALVDGRWLVLPRHTQPMCRPF
ncbi:hypothetical protein SBA3_150012 [Candidatus Sulfopaludibacter sp. SbA3]|nr:hypothetical protein SBA3_150012 [Candidatus Sulfopaludibacter sp. SbA3]